MKRNLPAIKKVGLLRFLYMQDSLYKQFQGKVAKNVAITEYPSSSSCLCCRGSVNGSVLRSCFHLLVACSHCFVLLCCLIAELCCDLL